VTVERTTLPPFDGVDAAEWALLLARGDAAGELHADAIAHVLRNVELSSEVLVQVRAELGTRNITIDEHVEEVPEDPTPVPGTTVVVTEEAEADEGLAGVFASRRRRRAARMLEKHETTSTSDTVRMYLKEIGRVDLLSATDERRLAQAIDDGNRAAALLDDD